MFEHFQILIMKTFTKYLMRLGLEVLVLELKLFKTKWLIIGIYKP